MRSHFSSLVTVIGAALALAFPFEGLTAESTESIAPEIGISLRGVSAGIVEQGEPLRVAVRLEPPPELSRAIVIEPATGTWAEAITVELASAGSGAIVARGEVVGRPESARATLDRGHVAGGIWRIPAGITARLAPGDYVVGARLAIPSGTGWTGEIVSDAVALRIVAPSGDPARIEQRVLALAQDAVLAGAPAEAARLLDAELVKNPQNIALLTARARVAASGGNLLAARLCVNRAMSLLPSDLRHPPLELNELNTQIMAALESASSPASPTMPPAWTWPPIKVITAPGNPAPPSVNPIVAAPTSASLPPAAAATVAPPAAGSAPAPVMAGEPSMTTGAIAGAIVAGGELTDAKVIADTAGQWAASATAGSQYGKTQYSAAQATGAPNVTIVGNSPDAWCPENKTVGTDWLEVAFAKPVQATEVRVRQNDSAGAITKIEAIEPDGTAHVWWEGVDPYKAPAVRGIAWFGVRVPKTSYLVAKFRITLNLAVGPGWKEIDAVQLVGTTP